MLGVFIDSITHLLVLSTPSVVHLIGLSYAPPHPSNGNKASFQLYILDLAISSGDGWYLTSIVSTSSGRIFGCSVPNSHSSRPGNGAGDLYEIIYQAKAGWRSDRAYLVNLSSGGSVVNSIMPSFLRGTENSGEYIMQLALDKERELLYTRTKKNSIGLWNIQKGQSEKIASVKDIRRMAGMLCPGTSLLNENNPFEIVGMEIINAKEGKGIGLVCVSNMGVRLYFTHLRGGLRGYGSTSSSTPPSLLELVHVRLPPQVPNPANNSISISCLPNAGGSAFLAANTVSDDADILNVFASDIGRLALATNNGNRLSLTEIAGQIPIEGRTWAIVESASPSIANVGQQFPGNELKSQIGTSISGKARREWLFLTNMGMHVIQRQRPVDTLLSLLDTAGSGGRDAELSAFAEALAT